MILVHKLNMFGQHAVCNSSVRYVRSVLHFYGWRMYCDSRKEILRQKIEFLQCEKSILKIFNSKNTCLLERLQFPACHIHALKLHYMSNGPYRSLQDLLRVEGINETVLDKLLQLIVENANPKKSEKLLKSMISPSIENILREEISTVLGIYIGPNVIAWTLLDREENIIDWDYESFLNVPVNETILTLLNVVSKLNLKLPKSDVYVLDETFHDHRVLKSSKHFKPFMQNQFLRVMILSFLANRNPNQENGGRESIGNLYLTHHEKVAKLFDIRIGNETTSSKRRIKRLLYQKFSPDHEEKNPMGVYVPHEILKKYETCGKHIQDQMNWSLLTALTFLQLVVHQKYTFKFV